MAKHEMKLVAGEGSILLTATFEYAEDFVDKDVMQPWLENMAKLIADDAPDCGDEIEVLFDGRSLGFSQGRG